MPATIPKAAESLSVPEMLRIMDVASALRRDRELVEEQLNVDEIRARLRIRLLEAAKVAGDEVTPEEVDAAIDQYFAGQHTYTDPPLSPMVALAHAYVRRGEILQTAMVGFVAIGFLWWLLFSSNGWLNARGRAQHRAEAVAADIDALRERLKPAAAADPNLAAELQSLADRESTYTKQSDVEQLRGLKSWLAALEKVVEEEYTIDVVYEGGRKSAVDRYFTDADGKRASGYYLIVEARTSDGKVVPRTIRNSETGKTKSVNTWAERVPKEVYDRLAHDKKSDGILDEHVFAVKKRGQAEEKIVLAGADGRPLLRMGQITEW